MVDVFLLQSFLGEVMNRREQQDMLFGHLIREVISEQTVDTWRHKLSPFVPEVSNTNRIV